MRSTVYALAAPLIISNTPEVVVKTEAFATGNVVWLDVIPLDPVAVVVATYCNP